MVLDHLLKEARKARLADDYDSAIKLCRAFLDVNPGAAHGESLLGLCEIETGRQEGAARIVKAAAAAPNDAQILLTLSILRDAEGDLRSAVIHASAAAKLAPQLFEAWAQLGKLLGKGERFDEALSALDEALKIRPDHAGVLLLYVVASIETGHFDSASQALDRAAHLGAPLAEQRRLRAHILRARGDAAALETFAEDWLKSAPDDAEARAALSFALAEQGYFDRAAAAFAPVAAAPEAGADKLSAMGRYLLGGRRLDEAAAWFKRALKIDPADIDANFGLARRSMFLGKLADAEAWCRRTLAAAPAHAEVFGLLIEATNGRLSDADMTLLNEALAGAPRRDESRIKLLFAKGDALHARKRHAEAFAAWSDANRLKKERAQSSGLGYDARAQEQKTDAIIRSFPAPQPPRAIARDGEPAPIFIIGMPRSGTTLLESALCAHPEVDGAGEVPAMPFYLDQFLQWSAQTGAGFDAVPAREIEGWRKGFFDQCKRFGWAGAAFVTDKQPTNYLSAGMIARIFPRARIIHIRRNPVETGFSIFRRHFSNQWSYATDLADIAHQYAEHCRLASHWSQAIGDRMAFVQYETLVADFENELRRLVAFCGLDWNDACLTYHEQDRSVMTFSAAQVREPPSKARLSSTGPYRAELAPMIDALERFGVDLETGALSPQGNLPRSLQGENHEH
ncbi:MAG: sulfotransferase [Parvularculaceae bacterium]|nr:sulfotransferase [Parvularculaceae bacterium]